MNGYELTRKWYRFASKNKRHVKPIHHALIHWIFERANRSEWDEEFQLPTNEAMDMLGVTNKKTYQDAFKDLVSFGAINLVQEAKGLHVARWVSLANCKIYQYDFVPSNVSSTVPGSAPSDVSDTVPSSVPSTASMSVPNIKPKETNKPNKPNKPINIDFIIFWDLYDNKVDKAKSEKKWNSLKDSERQAAIEDIPKYIQSLDDRKYQKNPHTYLNGKCWLDERKSIPQAQSQKNNLDPGKYYPNGLPRLVI